MGEHRKPDCYEIEEARKNEILSAGGGMREYSTNYRFYIEAQNHAFYFRLIPKKDSNGKWNEWKTVQIPPNDCCILDKNI